MTACCMNNYKVPHNQKRGKYVRSTHVSLTQSISQRKEIWKNIESAKIRRMSWWINYNQTVVFLCETVNLLCYVNICNTSSILLYISYSIVLLTFLKHNTNTYHWTLPHLHYICHKISFLCIWKNTKNKVCPISHRSHPCDHQSAKFLRTS